jgi:hypothetical protein
MDGMGKTVAESGVSQDQNRDLPAFRVIEAKNGQNPDPPKG